VTDQLAEFVRRAEVPDTRIRVIPNGINRARFADGASGAEARRELGLDGKVVLGFTGYIRAWHGLSRVVDLLADMPERTNLHFLVLGDGPDREDIEAHADARGVLEQVTFLGVVPRDRVGGYVAAFDIALQPRVTDYASPLKLFEYMALGCAIVGPDQSNIREVLTDRENSLLFAPDDDESFRAAVLALCRDEALRRRLGRAAARTIDDRNLTWDGNAERIEGLVEEVARRGADRDRAKP
jgi:glycosyltransferase involved in cell wall biosynthesis